VLPYMAKNVLIVIGLIVLGVLVFCLCCYKVTNLLYQLFTIDSQDSTEMVSPTEFDKKFNKPLSQNHNHLNQENEKSGGLPPDYREVMTPRCSRHAAAASHNFYSSNSLHDIVKNDTDTGKGTTDQICNSKSECVSRSRSNINHFPSAGELRDTQVGYNTSVERLLPPYPTYTPPQCRLAAGHLQPHRKSNGVLRSSGGYNDNLSVAGSPGPGPGQPSYSYSYTNINCGQDTGGGGGTHSHPLHSHCCTLANQHQLPQHHHLATMRRTPISSSSHASQHSRWCNSSMEYHHQHHPSLPASIDTPHTSQNSNSATSRYQAAAALQPYSRQLSSESLEDREVRAMFHRDTLLARIVRL